ncbi:lipoate--protein ligase family protein [Baekduia soli]|uniref:Lipoate--protein ligase family protein n=1 Tax=Baekduia soli TaxID=496014 RepID=A0A5B8U351_9ACTN|nr:lipoate--protein ligase family protein [Baekduia soli]QEC47362.1 lipoate--protein ligase family protein [Baekduia soli]
MLLLDVAHPEDPALDLAVSHALLRRVGAGALGPVVRVCRPGPTMAFGRLDALRPGYGQAAAAAAAHGFTPVLRLGGGRAAGYDHGSVLVEITTPTERIASGIEERFEDATALLVATLEAVGADPAVGELPGEYCPGRFSIHAGGRIKVAGTAQRSIRGASLVAAAIVVEGGDRLRAALVDVYAALGLSWDPATAGAVEDVAAGVGAGDVQEAVLDALRRRGPLEPAALDDATLELARGLRAAHAVDVP